ncbi:MAG: hypothetical protein CMJ18_26000 [Phycisphaeraceae bacterium]|nr:hypothetical protein [Phycisphaeraceae bacterium]
MRIGSHEVSEVAEHPFVIAEPASAHEGDVDRAIALTDAAVAAGADSIKYQIWSRDELLTPAHAQFDDFGAIELSRDQWLDVMSHARTKAICIAADVDDVASTKLALEGGAELLKVRTTNLAHAELLRFVAESGLPIALATGASTMEEIAYGLDVLDRYGAKDIMLIHGFQAFPTAPVDTHLRALGLLRERFGRLLGYADHADGDSPLAYLLPTAALAAGACAIEKHISIDREKRTEDFEASLNGPEFARMVQQLREVWQSLGEADHEMNDAERGYRKRFKKSIVSRDAIARGEIIDEQKLVFRIGGETGFPIDELASVVGRRAAVEIPALSVIRAEMLGGELPA